MKEYKIEKIKEFVEYTEDLLNDCAKDGWSLVCSCGKNNLWLVFEKEKRACSKCGK